MKKEKRKRHKQKALPFFKQTSHSHSMTMYLFLKRKNSYHREGSESNALMSYNHFYFLPFYISKHKFEVPCLVDDGFTPTHPPNLFFSPFICLLC